MEEMEHMFLIGDKKLEQMITDREFCIMKGFLYDNPN